MPDYLLITSKLHDVNETMSLCYNGSVSSTSWKYSNINSMTDKDNLNKCNTSLKSSKVIFASYNDRDNRLR